MESRSYSRSKRERVEVSDKKVEKEEKKSREAPQSETVQLVLLRNLKLNYKGPVSGRKYVFSGAGAILPVNKEDAEIMLKKNSGPCCEGSGSGQPAKYFAKA